MPVALMSYVSERRPNSFLRAAVFVDKILKGTKPADMPVEQPMKFEFVDQFENRQADRPNDPARNFGAGESDNSVEDGNR